MSKENPVIPDNIQVPNEVKQAMGANIPVSAQPQPKQYHSEQIDLPTQGWFYSPESPLSNGKIEIKFMTAKEEDILSSQNLIKKGVVLDKLLESLIVTPGVNLDDLLITDKNAVFIAARIFAYGPEYPIKFQDPSSGEEIEETIDLSKIQTNDFDFSKYDRGVNSFSYQLPISKDTIRYKILSHKDEKNINVEMKQLEKYAKGKTVASPEVTTRMKYMILGVTPKDASSEITDRGQISKYVDSMLSRDSQALRKYIKENTPDVDMTFNYTDDNGTERRLGIPMNPNFFWPDA